MNRNKLSKAVMLGLAGLASPYSLAQDPEDFSDTEIVEIVTVGRMRSAADDVTIERQESEIVADFIDSTTISRIGDSNVAAALRRVPGVTLVDDKFVFVRGLGERYSNSLLNGAQIPSPDLTRNVIPLDIFPTSILRSVAVQKGYSADMPAAFSGGLIDVRTKSIPNEFLLQFEVGSSYNSETSSDVMSYNGGGDDWLGKDDGSREISSQLLDAVDRYQGNLDVISIYQTLGSEDASVTFNDARNVNRELAQLLNRDIDVGLKNPGPNVDLDAAVGNNFFFDNGMDLGFILGASYGDSWSSRENSDRSAGDPIEIFANVDKSTRNVNLTGNASVGWKWYDDHSVQLTSILLRNTDDEAFTREYYDSSFNYSDGRGFLNYGTRFEQRQLEVNQAHGSHRFGGVTRDILNFNSLDWLDELKVDWFYSTSTSDTSIPNETSVTYQIDVDPVTGQILNQNLQPSPTAGDFRFTELNDEVENYGWDIKLPLYFRAMDVEFSGGHNYATKARQYQQTQYGLGTASTSVALGLTGLPSDIFSDENILNPANQLFVDVIGSNGESYLAAIVNASNYGKLDVTWNETWRMVAGVRWEDYSQVGLPWNPLNFTGCQISCDSDEILGSVFKEDDYYPSLAFTYMRDDFWAEQFQLRFGYSETLVRPDLREITPSSYIDPITGARVSGNSNVVPASVKNYDLRGEWFFDSGDTFTASFFYKDISDPIDLFEAAAFEEALATEIINAESSEVFGLEFEWLKNLGGLGEWADPFFVSGNLTLIDTELVAGSKADAPTNATRPLAGASENALNMQLGYDSWDGVHSAMLVYNVFSERLYFAGRNGTPDAYEQPFHSLDLTYFYYPSENVTVKLAAKNLLDEEVTIEQSGIETFSEKPGSTLSLSVKIAY